MGVHSAAYRSNHPRIAQLQDQAKADRQDINQKVQSGQITPRQARGERQQVNGTMRQAYGEANANGNNPGHLASRDQFDTAQAQLVNITGG
jgi:hypothetical protein